MKKFQSILAVGSQQTADAVVLLARFYQLQCVAENKLAAFGVSTCSQTPDQIVIHDVEDEGDPDQAIGFVALCGRALQLDGQFCLRWAEINNNSEMSDFGSGFHTIDLGTGATLAFVDTLADAPDPAGDRR